MLAEDSWEDIDSVGTSRRGTTGCLLVCFSDGQPLLCGQTWGRGWPPKAPPQSLRYMQAGFPWHLTGCGSQDGSTL